MHCPCPGFGQRTKTKGLVVPHGTSVLWGLLIREMGDPQSHQAPGQKGSKEAEGLEICWLVSLEKTVQRFQDVVAFPWGRAGVEGGEDVAFEPRAFWEHVDLLMWRTGPHLA